MHVVIISTCNPLHISLIVGVDPMESWGAFDVQAAEQMVTLILDELFTLMALFLPSRCCSLWFIPTARVIATIAVAVTVGSALNMISLVINFILLTALSVFFVHRCAPQ